MATITTTRTFTRPATNVAWFQTAHAAESQAFTTYLTDNYIVTGKIIDRTTSKTDLTNTIVIIWASASAMNSHYNDPVVVAHFADRDAYNESVGIVNELVVG